MSVEALGESPEYRQCDRFSATQITIAGRSSGGGQRFPKSVRLSHGTPRFEYLILAPKFHPSAYPPPQQAPL